MKIVLALTKYINQSSTVIESSLIILIGKYYMPACVERISHAHTRVSVAIAIGRKETPNTGFVSLGFSYIIFLSLFNSLAKVRKEASRDKECAHGSKFHVDKFSHSHLILLPTTKSCILLSFVRMKSRYLKTTDNITVFPSRAIF